MEWHSGLVSVLQLLPLLCRCAGPPWRSTADGSWARQGQCNLLLIISCHSGQALGCACRPALAASEVMAAAAGHADCIFPARLVKQGVLYLQVAMVAARRVAA